MTLPSRLESMVQNPNLGRGSARTSHDHAERQVGMAISAEEAFAQREKLHLGFNFQVIGDLRNWTKGWSHIATSAVPFFS